MLVLTRKIGEGIVIGDSIKVTLIEAKGGSVRIGIDAPRDTKIYREEVFNKIVEENRDATHWDMGDLDKITETFKSDTSK